MNQPKWGIVATIKAPTREVLRFVAYHLDQGATRITVYLDDCNAETAKALTDHPQTQAILTDETYWQDTLGRRPKKHQVRQMQNASHCYEKANELDWLAHIDVDEFLCPSVPISDVLAEQSNDTYALRVAPCESLCTDDRDDVDPNTTYCKAKLPSRQEGRRLEQLIYPNFGGVLKSGFVSHVVGKVFVRTGLPDVRFAIHRAFKNQDEQILDVTSSDVELCHRHIESWEKWLAIMEFRLTQGSYREELEKSLNPMTGRIQRHQLFSSLTQGGTEDLRAFFEEVCWATPRLRKVLAEQGYLREYQLELDSKLAKHFPEFA